TVTPGRWRASTASARATPSPSSHLAGAVEALHLPGVTVDADYQLTVEDSAAAAEHDVVIFADAARVGPEPLSFRRVEPVASLGFSSHGCRPPAVLALARDLFGASPAGYILGIRGYEFDRFGETLSDAARANLAAAETFLVELLKTRSFASAAARFADGRQVGLDREEPSCKTENT
ncbi:MAG: hypothetical protein J7M21_03105, partial [Planctomycetes bacterium]|nr:hypothetical protein [Planctomycetota bacterium]